MAIEIDDSHKFWVGVTLFVFQAGQSLDRAISGMDIDGLRQFYAERPDPRNIAMSVLEKRAPLAYGKWKIIRIEIVSQEERFIIGQLLLDFARVLEGLSCSADELACLRYCLTFKSLQLLKKLRLNGSINLGDLICYNSSGQHGSMIDLNDVVGDGWSDRK